MKELAMVTSDAQKLDSILSKEIQEEVMFTWFMKVSELIHPFSSLTNKFQF